METFRAIKEKLDPFLSRPLVESFEAIEKAAGGELQQACIAQARLLSLLSFSMQTLLFAYLQLHKQDVKQHPVREGIARVKEYMKRIESSIERIKARQQALRLNKTAADRLVKASISFKDSKSSAQASLGPEPTKDLWAGEAQGAAPAAKKRASNSVKPKNRGKRRKRGRDEMASNATSKPGEPAGAATAGGSDSKKRRTSGGAETSAAAAPSDSGLIGSSSAGESRAQDGGLGRGTSGGRGESRVVGGGSVPQPLRNHLSWRTQLARHEAQTGTGGEKSS